MPHQSAGLAQLVEHQLPKLRVAGSNPVSRSDFRRGVGTLLLWVALGRAAPLEMLLADLLLADLLLADLNGRHLNVQAQLPAAEEKPHA